MKDTTRRGFLKYSAMGLAATAASEALPLASKNAAAQTSRSETNGEISRWVTADKLRFARQEPVSWRRSTGSAQAIVLNPQRKFQKILGFGGAFTEAACVNFAQLPAEARQKLFHELFHSSEMALNVCRTCMGASDYSTEVYSYDEGDPDPELKRFSIEHDRQNVLPALRDARKENPDLFLFSSPWSPPGWMKSGGSMLGGSMRRRYIPNYAQYFVKFLQSYQAEGVAIDAVTVQNEVDTDQDARMPACIWPQEYEIEFVGKHLGPLLEQNGMKTKIWVLDHNYNLWGRAVAELDDPGVRRYSNAVAWHGYVGNPEMMSKAHEAHPDADNFWTEGGSFYTDPDYLTDWAKWGNTYTGILRNWCSSITAWNLALDEQGKPNIGPFTCGGLVTIHSQTKEISRSGQFWATAHFSRAIRCGAERLESEGDFPGVSHAAFENPDGTRVVVVTNGGSARTVNLRLGDHESPVPLEANSITTLQWSSGA